MIIKIIFGCSDDKTRYVSPVFSKFLPAVGDIIKIPEGMFKVASVIHDYVDAEIRIYCDDV